MASPKNDIKRRKYNILFGHALYDHSYDGRVASTVTYRENGLKYSERWGENPYGPKLTAIRFEDRGTWYIHGSATYTDVQQWLDTIKGRVAWSVYERALSLKRFLKK